MKSCLGLTFTGVRGDHSCRAGLSRDPFFSVRVFCLGVITGLFPGDGLVVSLSGHF